MRRHEAKSFGRPRPDGSDILVTKVTDLRPLNGAPSPFAIAIEARYGSRTGGRWFVHCEGPDDQNERFRTVCEAAPDQMKKYYPGYAGFRLARLGQGHALADVLDTKE